MANGYMLVYAAYSLCTSHDIALQYLHSMCKLFKSGDALNLTALGNPDRIHTQTISKYVLIKGDSIRCGVSIASQGRSVPHLEQRSTPTWKGLGDGDCLY